MKGLMRESLSCRQSQIARLFTRSSLGRWSASACAHKGEASMIQSARLSVMMLVLALMFGAATAVFAADATGKIKSVDGDKGEFVITDNNNKNWTFHLAKDSKAFINDKEAKLGDLQLDNEVTIKYERDGAKLMASEVRCKRSN
jgi:hypothetical protein